MTEFTLFGVESKPPKTSNPVKQDIELRLKEGGTEKVEAAEVLGGLAVHRNGKNGGWRLTHVASGALLKIYHYKKAAQAARAEILAAAERTPSADEVDLSFDVCPSPEVKRAIIEAMKRAPRD